MNTQVACLTLSPFMPFCIQTQQGNMRLARLATHLAAQRFILRPELRNLVRRWDAESSGMDPAVSLPV